MKKILVIRNVKNLIIMFEKTNITKKNSSWDILVIRRVKTTVWGREAVGTVIVHAYQHVTGLGDRSTRYLSFTALPSLSFFLCF